MKSITKQDYLFNENNNLRDRQDAKHKNAFGREIQDYKLLHIGEISDLASEIAVLSQNVVSKNVNFFIDYLNSLLKKEYFDLPHPTKINIPTRARNSIRYGMYNYIFFTDIAGGNPWIFVQHGNFVDAIILPGKIYKIIPSPRKIDKQIFNSLLKLIEQITTCTLSWSQSKLLGLVVGAARPFHFFYDQFISLSSIDLPSDKIIIGSNKVFYPLESLIEFRNHDKAINNSGVFLSPSTIRQDSLHTFFKKKCYLMEKRVFEYAVKNSSVDLEDKKYDFILWIGITGQKRSWLEQVEGYGAIINNLARTYERLLVLIDGFTVDVTHKQNFQKMCAEDELVVSKIKELVSTQVEVLSLVGLDYETKTKYCSYVNAFIANAGTGSMVPLRFCKKPGVLHINTRVVPHQDNYPATVIKIENRFVIDHLDTSNESPDRTSYHIHWQHIYQALAKVIKLTKGDELPPIEAPSEKLF